MNKEELFSTLRNKKPMIYKLSERYYFIGMAVFAECTAEQIQIFDSFRKELSELHDHCTNLNSISTIHSKKLAEALDSIERIHKFDFSESQAILAKDKLWQFLKELSQEDAEKLETQIVDYIEAMNFKDRYDIDKKVRGDYL